MLEIRHFLKKQTKKQQKQKQKTYKTHSNHIPVPVRESTQENTVLMATTLITALIALLSKFVTFLDPLWVVYGLTQGGHTIRTSWCSYRRMHAQMLQINMRKIFRRWFYQLFFPRLYQGTMILEAYQIPFGGRLSP